MVGSVSLTCPNCGAPVSEKDEKCPYCKSPLSFATLHSVGALSSSFLDKQIKNCLKILANDQDNKEVSLSLGLCYLKLKFYQKALKAFEKIGQQNIDNPDIYFFTAIALLNGKKPFVSNKNIITEIITNLEAALSIEEKGIYYYFLAYIYYDYFYRKHFKEGEYFISYLTKSNEYRLSSDEKNELFSILNVEKPNCL